MSEENAVLMAAGLGTRMLPLTEKVPKPLVKVFEKPMIETVIDGLILRHISHIYVVVGYKAEQFEYLTQKYSNVSLIENKEYAKKNNISSIYAAADVIKKSDCFICEADLFISDPTIFLSEHNSSCYYGKMVKGYSDDWIFDVDENNIITRIGKGGTNKYNMVGISFFKQNDAEIIANAVKNAYNIQGNEKLFWDEIVDQNISKLHLNVNLVQNGQITEIDSVDELNKLDPDYRKYNL